MKKSSKCVFLIQQLNSLLLPIQSKTDRKQVRFSSFEEQIRSNNAVSFIDAFVDKLDLPKLKITTKTIKTEGRPVFENSGYLRPYLYGYFNGLGSSRKLESEYVRNIELHLAPMWPAAQLPQQCRFSKG